MPFTFPCRRLVSTLFAAGLLSVSAATVLAAPPSPNSDVAGAPRPVQASPASLKITVRTCPATFDPNSDDADPAAMCQEKAGDTLFALSLGDQPGPSASTGFSGDAAQKAVIGFTGLTPGRYLITSITDESIASAFVGSCASSIRDFSAYPFRPFAIAKDGVVAVELKSGEEMACDWYQIAAATT